MPLSKKGKKIKTSMEKHYGAEKGEDVFYASQQKGIITGTHKGKKKKKHSLVSKTKKRLKKVFGGRNY